MSLLKLFKFNKLGLLNKEIFIGRHIRELYTGTLIIRRRNLAEAVSQKKKEAEKFC